jgi:carbamoyltransferase
MQATMNLKIKFRESFRPFAPIVLRDRASEYFDLKPDEESPYMLLVAPLADRHRIAESSEKLRGLEKLKTARSVIPAVTHVDYSARIQTVDPQRHERLHRCRRLRDEDRCPVMTIPASNAGVIVAALKMPILFYGHQHDAGAERFA